MYISGRGIRQNIDEGKKWLTKAAEQGDVTAKANLAWLSQQGYIKSDAASNEADKAE
jgi:TPR repeat protein